MKRIYARFGDLCFEREDDPWFRWYFRELYRPEDVLAGEGQGK